MARCSVKHDMRDKTAVLSGLLAAGLYTAFAVLVSHYTLYSIEPNPSNTKIVLLCECLKVLVSLGAWILSSQCPLLSEQSYQNIIDNSLPSTIKDQRNGTTARQGSGSSNQQQQLERSPLKSPSSAFRVAGKDKAATVNPYSTELSITWAGLAAFIVPAVAYCAANNLLLHTLTLLPAYAYASLSIVKIPAAALLTSWSLSSSIDSSTRWNLALVLLGACMSQMACYRAFPASEFAMANGSSSFWSGCVALLGAVVLSAAAAAYLAWLGTWRQQQQQNQLLSDTMQLSAAGAVVAAAYHLLHGGKLWQFLGNVHLEHWAAAAALAALGLLQASPLLQPSSSSNSKRVVTIAKSGNAFGSNSFSSSSSSSVTTFSIGRAYGLTLAAVFTAWASKPALALHVPLLYYAGACVALLGVMRMHYNRSQTLPRIKSRVNLLLGDCGGWRPVLIRLWKYAFVAKIAVLLLLPLLVAFMPAETGKGSPAVAARLAALSSHLRTVAGGSSTGPGHRAFNSAVQYAAAGISELALEATTKAPLPAVLHLGITHQPAAAALTAPNEQEDGTDESATADLVNSSSGRAALCAPLTCSTVSSCTARDPHCCAHLQSRMLAYWDRFMASKGLAQQHFLVYNSLLAAQRSRTLDAESLQLDVAVGSHALLVLQQFAAQQRLWRHGYVMVYSSNSSSSSSSSVSNEDGRTQRSSGSNWRLCPHSRHPLPEFQRHMQQQQQQQQKEGRSAGKALSLALHLMWEAPAADNAASSSRDKPPVGHVVNITISQGMVNSSSSSSNSHHQDDETAGGHRRGFMHWLLGSKPSPSSSSSSIHTGSEGIPTAAAEGEQQHWRLCGRYTTLVRSSGSVANVSGLALPVPDNAADHLAEVYGHSWQTARVSALATSVAAGMRSAVGIECVQRMQQLVGRLNGTASHGRL